MPSFETIRAAVQALDTMERECTAYEAGVLNTVLRQLRVGRGPTPKQARIVREMVETYLKDGALLAELETS